MPAKGSKLSRAIEFFKEADLEEAGYVLSRAQQIMADRKMARQAVPASNPPVQRRTRNRKPKAINDRQAMTAVADEGRGPTPAPQQSSIEEVAGTVAV